MIYEYNENFKIKGLYLVFFYAGFTKSCQINEGVFNGISINILRVNTTKFHNMKHKYNISKIPSFILVNDGNIISKYDGILNSKSIEDWIRKFKR